RSTAPRAIWNVTRQGGKSSVAALLAIHTALYVPSSLTLLVSASLRQSGELFRTVTGFWRRLAAPPLVEDHKLSLTTATGARIVSLPSIEGTIRGFSAVTLLIEDESARVADAVHAACRPMLATSNGRLLLMSTPCGQRGHFWETWHGGTGWERVEIRADQCPRIPAAFLAAERASLPAATYRQEYECSFEAVADAVFAYSDVQAA